MNICFPAIFSMASLRCWEDANHSWSAALVCGAAVPFAERQSRNPNLTRTDPAFPFLAVLLLGWAEFGHGRPLFSAVVVRAASPSKVCFLVDVPQVYKPSTGIDRLKSQHVSRRAILFHHHSHARPLAAHSSSFAWSNLCIALRSTRPARVRCLADTPTQRVSALGPQTLHPFRAPLCRHHRRATLETRFLARPTPRISFAYPRLCRRPPHSLQG